MSSSSYAPSKPAIRGVALAISNDAVTSTDTQLAKALEGRDSGSIAWSPDGLRDAWIQGQDVQTCKIMWAVPGKAAAVLYQPADTDDAYVDGGSDGLAWGPACSGVGSTLATLLSRDDIGAARYEYTCSDDPRPGCPCGGDSETVCLDYPHPAVHSIDWPGDAGRLALSVTTGPDPDYPWRDLRVACLGWNEGNGQWQKIRIEQIALDPFFGPASSEHSPQWGSGATDNDCARQAFSQSAGASDGSTMNGRRLYLYDLMTTSTACFDGPREVSASDPRAIDWK